jgi:hypothetical protein
LSLAIVRDRFLVVPEDAERLVLYCAIATPGCLERGERVGLYQQSFGLDVQETFSFRPETKGMAARKL